MCFNGRIILRRIIIEKKTPLVRKGCLWNFCSYTWQAVTYTLVPKPYVELASVPGLARCFLGDLTNFVFLHPIVSNRSTSNSTDLLPDMPHKPAEGSVMFDLGFNRAAGAVCTSHLQQDMSSTSFCHVHLHGAPVAAKGPLTWAGLLPGGHRPVLAAACDSSLVPSARGSQCTSGPSTCLDSEQGAGAASTGALRQLKGLSFSSCS